MNKADHVFEIDRIQVICTGERFTPFEFNVLKTLQTKSDFGKNTMSLRNLARETANHPKLLSTVIDRINRKVPGTVKVHSTGRISEGPELSCEISLDDDYRKFQLTASPVEIGRWPRKRKLLPFTVTREEDLLRVTSPDGQNVAVDPMIFGNALAAAENHLLFEGQGSVFMADLNCYSSSHGVNAVRIYGFWHQGDHLISIETIERDIWWHGPSALKEGEEKTGTLITLEDAVTLADICRQREWITKPVRYNPFVMTSSPASRERGLPVCSA